MVLLYDTTTRKLSTKQLRAKSEYARKVYARRFMQEGNSREQVFWQMVILFILVVTISEARHVLFQLDA